MRFLAQIQEMASSDIMSIISAGIYERIKARDKKPLFKAFVIGHEGYSTGRVVGEGNIVKRWLASAIQKLHDKLQIGLKVFHNHSDTNEHEGRPAIGEVVGRALKFIDDRLSAVAVAYIKPEYRRLPLDVASIEADVRLREDSGIYDVDVGDITGVALGNSAISKPGFAGATLLAQLQEFADTKLRTTHGRRTMENELTTEEVRQFLRAKKIQPSDVYDIGTLTADPTITGYIENVEKRSKREALGHLQRDGEAFEKQKGEWATKEAAYQKQIKERDTELGKTRIPAAFEKLAAARKLTKQQKDFILIRLPKFAPTDPAKTEEELSIHLDSELDQLKKEAEVFGVKLDQPADGDKTGDKKPGGEPEGDKKTPPEGDAKYLDPDFNPMIPKVG